MVEYHVPNFPSCSCWSCGICAFIIMYVYPNAPCMEYVPALAQKLTQPCVVVCLLWSSLLLSWRHLGFAISKSPDSIPTSRSCTSNRFPTMPKGPPHSSMSGTNQPRHKWWYGRATSSTWTYFCHENWSCPPNIRYYLTNLRATKVTFSRVSRGQNMAKPISEATTSHPFQQVFCFFPTSLYGVLVFDSVSRAPSPPPASSSRLLTYTTINLTYNNFTHTNLTYINFTHTHNTHTQHTHTQHTHTTTHNNTPTHTHTPHTHTQHTHTTHNTNTHT